MKDLEEVVKPLFRTEKLRLAALEAIKLIKEKKWVRSRDIISTLGLTKSQWYDTIMPTLKEAGLIRRRGAGYELDSRYSLVALRRAKIWIDFAEIKRSQPEQLKELIWELMK